MLYSSVGNKPCCVTLSGGNNQRQGVMKRVYVNIQLYCIIKCCILLIPQSQYHLLHFCMNEKLKHRRFYPFTVTFIFMDHPQKV